MAMTEARKRANKKWNDANMAARYDRIQLVVPKGQKQAIRAHARGKGYDSLSAYTKALYEADSGLSMDIKQTAEE